MSLSERHVVRCSELTSRITALRRLVYFVYIGFLFKKVQDQNKGVNSKFLSLRGPTALISFLVAEH
jgi:hypothetical protein